MPGVNASIESLVHSAVIDEYRLLFATYVSAHCQCGLRSLDFKIHGPTLSCGIFPSIELPS